jgi:hypothetical protein
LTVELTSLLLVEKNFYKPTDGSVERRHAFFVVALAIFWFAFCIPFLTPPKPSAREKSPFPMYYSYIPRLMERGGCREEGVDILANALSPRGGAGEE